MRITQQGIAVIGAGLAGLSAARVLTDAGLPVTLFDSQPRPGGRLGHEGPADMAAQYFTARHPAFRQATREWQNRGWIADWTPHLYLHDQEYGLRPSSDDIQRMVAVPHMAALAQQLRQDIPFEHCAVERLRRTTEGDWLVHAGNGTTHGPFDALVLAVPADVAAPLLEVAPQLQQDVARVHLRPCWSVALTFAEPLQTQVDACFVRDGPLDWLARNSSKPGRGDGEVWVVQSTSSWAERHADSSAQEVIAELSQAMAEVLGQPLPEPGASQAQFWPQARPAEQLKWGALAAPRLNLYVCGDWCLGGRIENAWLSGRQAARALLDG